MARRLQFATPETLERLRSEYGRQLAERALVAAEAGSELAAEDFAFRSVSVLAGAGDPGSCLPLERTAPGTPCLVCGKPLSKTQLRHAPWATTCNQPCFMTQVLRSMPAWQLKADRARSGASVNEAGRLAGPTREAATSKRSRR